MLILYGFLRVVDHEDFNRTFSRLQLKPQLLLHRSEEGGAGVISRG